MQAELAKLWEEVVHLVGSGEPVHASAKTFGLIPINVCRSRDC